MDTLVDALWRSALRRHRARAWAGGLCGALLVALSMQALLIDSTQSTRNVRLIGGALAAAGVVIGGASVLSGWRGVRRTAAARSAEERMSLARAWSEALIRRALRRLVAFVFFAIAAPLGLVYLASATKASIPIAVPVGIAVFWGLVALVQWRVTLPDLRRLRAQLGS